MSRWLFAGYCTGVMSVILPPETVIWTWTGPHRVSTLSPVKVPSVPCVEAPDGPDASDDPDAPDDPDASDVVVGAGAGAEVMSPPSPSGCAGALLTAPGAATAVCTPPEPIVLVR